MLITTCCIRPVAICLVQHVSFLFSLVQHVTLLQHAVDCLCLCMSDAFTIFTQGAAIEDGRLRPGDRLLEIDGAEVTGLSQQQVVQVLRAVSPGQTVQLALSRHEQTEDRRAEEDGQVRRRRC